MLSGKNPCNRLNKSGNTCTDSMSLSSGCCQNFSGVRSNRADQVAGRRLIVNAVFNAANSQLRKGVSLNEYA